MSELQDDLDNGFFITDPDDGYQRCKKLSDTTFHYKAYQTFDDIICIDDINQEEAIQGYYGSLAEVHRIYGSSANMIIAECYFENSVMNYA